MSAGDGNPQTPFQEAISLITIVAILVGVGAYMAALENVPLLSPALFWVALQVYQLFPALMRLPGDQVPMLVCGRLDRNVVLHLHDTASLLVGRSVQPSRN